MTTFQLEWTKKNDFFDLWDDMASESSHSLAQSWQTQQSTSGANWRVYSSHPPFREVDVGSAGIDFTEEGL